MTKGYTAWLTANAQGYVLNIQRSLARASTSHKWMINFIYA
jgi:hypothetical protein